jgi:hypothetical protein
LTGNRAAQGNGCGSQAIAAIIAGIFVVIAALIGLIPWASTNCIIRIDPKCNNTVASTSISLKLRQDTGLRDKPSFYQFSYVSDAKKGDSFPVLGKIQGTGIQSNTWWYQITLSNKQTAWINSIFVEPVAQNDQIPTLTSTP